MERKAGILSHISSLPSKHGIGDLGTEAYRLIELMAESHLKIWQILPLGPNGPGNSPYQAYSAYAGDPLLISLELLCDWELLTPDDLNKTPRFPTHAVNFELVEKFKMPLFTKAWQNFETSADVPFRWEFQAFLDEHGWWLNDYALFMAIRKSLNNDCWNKWPIELKKRETKRLEEAKQQNIDAFNLERFIQFMFFRQWFRLKKHANDLNVFIFGDIPLYVSLDSSDVWSNQALFNLDEDGKPIEVGGVPPDYFSAEGQLWGNPVFNWDALAQTDYHWWMARMHFNLHLFNLVRIDHFRGLVAYWSVPTDAPNAITGHWLPAHGFALLTKLKEQLQDLPIIAEDLGLITPDVDELRNQFNLPGMKVLQFALTSDSQNVHLPHNFSGRNVVYTGTHDNNTTMGWLNELDKTEQGLINAYFGTNQSNYFERLIEWAWQSTAELAIIPIQDLLKLDSTARMNTPGTATGNWRWRLSHNQLQKKYFSEIKTMNIKYNRSHETDINHR